MYDKYHVMTHNYLKVIINLLQAIFLVAMAVLVVISSGVAWATLPAIASLFLFIVSIRKMIQSYEVEKELYNEN